MKNSRTNKTFFAMLFGLFCLFCLFFLLFFGLTKTKATGLVNTRQAEGIDLIALSNVIELSGVLPVQLASTRGLDDLQLTEVLSNRDTLQDAVGLNANSGGQLLQKVAELEPADLNIIQLKVGHIGPGGAELLD